MMRPPDPDDFELAFWRVKTVSAKIGLSHAWIWKHVHVGDFPKPTVIRRRKDGMARITVWLAADVRQWMRQQLEVARH